MAGFSWWKETCSDRSDLDYGKGGAFLWQPPGKSAQYTVCTPPPPPSAYIHILWTFFFFFLLLIDSVTQFGTKQTRITHVGPSGDFLGTLLC